MSAVTMQVTLSPVEYERLKVIARRQQRSVEALVRDAVERVYLRSAPAQPTRFAELRAFGMWRNDSRTDEELLDAFGGDWTDFPLNA